MDKSEEIALFALQLGVATSEQQKVCYTYLQGLLPKEKPKRPLIKEGDLTREFEMGLLVERYLDKDFQDEVFELEPELKRENFNSLTAYKQSVVYPAIAEIFEVEPSTVKKADTNWKKYLKEHKSSNPLSLDVKANLFLGYPPQKGTNNGFSKEHFKSKRRKKWDTLAQSMNNYIDKFNSLSKEQRIQATKVIRKRKPD